MMVRWSLNTAAIAALAGFACTAQAELYKNVSPGGNFDFSHWSLTIPVDANGGNEGKAITIRPPALQGPNGYSSEYFYTDPKDGGVVFFTTIVGAKGGTSPNSRSELREMLDPTKGSVNWYAATKSVLNAQLRVLEVPSNGRVIIGQIHGYGNGQTLLGLQYEYKAKLGTGNVVAVVIDDPDPKSTRPHQRLTVASGIPLNQSFSYKVDIAGNGQKPNSQATLTFTVNNGTPVSTYVDPLWDTVPLYFKAGSYPQDHDGDDSEVGRVKFFQIAASHPDNGLQIRTSNTLPPASASASYETALASRGGVGAKTWKLVSGHPPAGMTLTADGRLTGVPDAKAVSSKVQKFTAQVRDAAGDTAHKEFRVSVMP